MDYLIKYPYKFPNLLFCKISIFLEILKSGL